MQLVKVNTNRLFFFIQPPVPSLSVRCFRFIDHFTPAVKDHHRKGGHPGGKQLPGEEVIIGPIAIRRKGIGDIDITVLRNNHFVFCRAIMVVRYQKTVAALMTYPYYPGRIPRTPPVPVAGFRWLQVAEPQGRGIGANAGIRTNINCR